MENIFANHTLAPERRELPRIHLTELAAKLLRSLYNDYGTWKRSDAGGAPRRGDANPLSARCRTAGLVSPNLRDESLPDSARARRPA